MDIQKTFVTGLEMEVAERAPRAHTPTEEPEPLSLKAFFECWRRYSTEQKQIRLQHKEHMKVVYEQQLKQIHLEYRQLVHQVVFEAWKSYVFKQRSRPIYTDNSPNQSSADILQHQESVGTVKSKKKPSEPTRPPNPIKRPSPKVSFKVRKSSTDSSQLNPVSSEVNIDHIVNITENQPVEIPVKTKPSKSNNTHPASPKPSSRSPSPELATAAIIRELEALERAELSNPILTENGQLKIDDDAEAERLIKEKEDAYRLLHERQTHALSILNQSCGDKQLAFFQSGIAIAPIGPAIISQSQTSRSASLPRQPTQLKKTPKRPSSSIKRPKIEAKVDEGSDYLYKILYNPESVKLKQVRRERAVFLRRLERLQLNPLFMETADRHSDEIIRKQLERIML